VLRVVEVHSRSMNVAFVIHNLGSCLGALIQTMDRA